MPKRRYTKGEELCALVLSWQMQVSFATQLRYMDRYPPVHPAWEEVADVVSAWAQRNAEEALSNRGSAKGARILRPILRLPECSPRSPRTGKG